MTAVDTTAITRRLALYGGPSVPEAGSFCFFFGVKDSPDPKFTI